MTESTGSYEVKLKTTYGASSTNVLLPKPPVREKHKDFKFDEKKKD
jgi:hypothetical protein